MYFTHLHLITPTIHRMYMLFEESLSYHAEPTTKEFDCNVPIIKLSLFCLHENQLNEKTLQNTCVVSNC